MIMFLFPFLLQECIHQFVPCSSFLCVIGEVFCTHRFFGTQLHLSCVIIVSLSSTLNSDPIFQAYLTHLARDRMEVTSGDDYLQYRLLRDPRVMTGNAPSFGWNSSLILVCCPGINLLNDGTVSWMFATFYVT